MEDWLGNNFDVGDRIIYAAMSGRSVTMVLGEVVSLNDSGTVTVKPLKSSRWQQHSDRTRYVDERTGKGIDPWKHIKRDGCHVRDDTGERLTDDEWRTRYTSGLKYHYERTVFNDYVKEVTEPPKPVTLTVTKNITRWFGADGGETILVDR